MADTGSSLPAPLERVAGALALTTTLAHTPRVLAECPAGSPTTSVSYYGPGFYGRTTAYGEILKRGTTTAASPTLPYNTRVEFNYGGNKVIVRINDTGPWEPASVGPGLTLRPHPTRLFDLEKEGAFAKLGDVTEGVLHNVTYCIR